MVRPIMKDPLFLAMKAESAGEQDQDVIRDLQDTLQACRDRCVGMAANMIGQRKRIIIVSAGPVPLVMVNPRLLSGRDVYEVEEGCLSLPGIRKTTRYRHITVAYLDSRFKPKTGSFEGYPAQIIQHELDHCEGILI